MNLSATPQFKRKLNKIVRKNPRLKSRFTKQTDRFKKNPRYPSLKTHKLAGNRSEQYAFWIEKDLRIVFIQIGQDVIFTDILTHDEY